MPTPTSSPAGSRTKKKRTTYDHAFKLKVVRAALERPPNNRIKPTCAWFPGIEPCQAEHGHPLNPSLPHRGPTPSRSRRVLTIIGSTPPIARPSPRHKKPGRDGLSMKRLPVSQLRKWIRNLEEEARPGSSANPTYPAYPPTAAPAKAQAKPKPVRPPKASLEPSVSALASQRTPRRAAAGAVARLRIVLHEHDDLDDEESEEDATGEEEEEEEEEEVSATDGASDDGLSFGDSPPSTPRGADELAGGADWSRR